MPRYTFVIPANFAFDVDADNEKEAREKAEAVKQQADRSDGWSAPDVDALFPRVSIDNNATPTVEDVYRP